MSSSLHSPTWYSLFPSQWNRSQIIQYLSRITKPTSQLDLQQSIHTMRHILILNPKDAFVMNRRMKMTKGHYYRDDPGFVFLLGWFVICIAFSYSIAFGAGSAAEGNSTQDSTGLVSLGVLIFSSMWRYIRFCLWLFLVDYLICGLIIATVGFIIGNHFLGGNRTQLDAERMNSSYSPTSRRNYSVMDEASNFGSRRERRSLSSAGTHSFFDDDEDIHSQFAFDDDSVEDEPIRSFGHNDQPILEWLYCFDIHLNAFFGFFCVVYVAQYLLLPLLLRENFFTISLGNTLYALGFTYYLVITFYGYLEVKGLKRTEVFLAPIAFVFIAWLLSITFQVHVVSHVLSRWVG